MKIKTTLEDVLDSSIKLPKRRNKKLALNSHMYAASRTSC